MRVLCIDPAHAFCSAVSGKNPFRIALQRTDKGRGRCSQVQFESVFLHDLCNSLDEARSDADALIIRQHDKPVNPFRALLHREIDDPGMTDDFTVDHADILLRRRVQVGIQIVILPEYFPYLLFNCVVNPVYFQVDFGAVELSPAVKKRFSSVSYIQSGSSQSMMSR